MSNYSPKQIRAIRAKIAAAKAAATENAVPVRTRSEAEIKAIRGYYARRTRDQATQAA